MIALLGMGRDAVKELAEIELPVCVEIRAAPGRILTNGDISNG